MDYPCANFDTIWSSNVNTTNIFQFLTIFAQNLAILPQKREVPHFQEVYQTFLESGNPKDEIGIGHLLYSKNSHGGQKCDTRASTIYLMLISSDLIGQSAGRQFSMSHDNFTRQLFLINQCWNSFQKLDIRHNKIYITIFRGWYGRMSPLEKHCQPRFASVYNASSRWHSTMSPLKNIISILLKG